MLRVLRRDGRGLCRAALRRLLTPPQQGGHGFPELVVVMFLPQQPPREIFGFDQCKCSFQRMHCPIWFVIRL